MSVGEEKNHSLVVRPLEHRLEQLLDRRRANSTLRTLTLPKTNQTDFSSNDFLSLSSSPLLKNAYNNEIRNTDLPLGSGGSRLLDGNSTYAEDLECEIARFHGAKTGLLFNSGFDANAGFFACVPQPGDVIVYDELVHASTHDGMRLSRTARTVSFQHNSPDDLKKTLEDVLLNSEQISKGDASVFVAVEAIYSMDGDVAPLRDIVDVVEHLLGTERSLIIVDEAHSTGVLGLDGRGLVCELELEHRIFARLHTFGKALAGNGAIILGSPTLRHYLINYARPLIYTTSLSFPCLALIRSSYGLLISGKTKPMQAHLHDLTQTLFTSMRELHRSNDAVRGLLQLPCACPKSPILAIQLDRPRALAQYLQDYGMMVRAVVPPTVPIGTQRVRVCLHAGNTLGEVKKLVDALAVWCEAQSQSMESGVAEKAGLLARL